MHTLRGDIPEEELRKHVIEEEFPDGRSVTTQYFASDGELVRQDVQIELKKGALSGSESGKFTQE
jgi:hypothetical protein